jgi:arylsulfatase A-like enzyme
MDAALRGPVPASYFSRSQDTPRSTSAHLASAIAMLPRSPSQPRNTPTLTTDYSIADVRGATARSTPDRGVPAVRGAILLAFLLLGGTIGSAAQEASPARPNIVWISAEDLSLRIGSYGDPLARTPTIDRLASEGMRFTRAFVTLPICAPSRTAIITGMYQNAIGAMHMRTTENRVEALPGPYLAVPPHYVKAFPEYLRAAGYYTTNNSKTDYQFGTPFTIWDESSPRAHWRNRPDPAQPFFAVFNFTGTHESQVWADSPSRRGKPLVTDPGDVEVPPYYPDTRAVREDLARHYDNIADLDAWTDNLLRQLEEDGLLENTIVFFWTDHGDGLPRAKRALYDSGLHVPLIVRWPDELQPGSLNDELVSLIDLAPTVLSLAGVPIPVHMQGRVILGDAKGPAPEYVFAGVDRVDMAYDMIRAARDGRFKYIRNFYPHLPYAQFVAYRNNSAIMQELLRLHAEGALTGAQTLWMADQRPPEELYDTETDPHEIRNLATDPAHATRLRRMSGALDDWMSRIGDQGLVAEAELVQQMWPGGVQPRTGTPLILPRRATDVAEAAIHQLEGPTEVVVYTPTQGSSVAFTTEAGDDAVWRLYTGPILVEAPVTIRARAIRYGYEESEEARAVFELPSREAARGPPPR